MPRLSRLAAMAAVLLCHTTTSRAQCVLPHTIANGQPADASKLMANFNALVACVGAGGSTNAIQYNAGGGALGGVGPMTNGQLVIGSTGNPAQAQTLTAGSGIVVTNNPGSVTISAADSTNASGLYRQLMSATPSAASTGLASWFNQGASTATDTAVGLSIDSPSTGTTVNMAGRHKPAPVAPYTITALIAATRNSSSWGAVGLGWFDGNNRLHLMAYSLESGSPPVFLVQRWIGASWQGTDFSSADNAFAQPIWLRLKDDGTNVAFAFSHDGANFLTIYSVAKASGFLGSTGYSNVIFFNDARGGRSVGTIMSWTQN